MQTNRIALIQALHNPDKEVRGLAAAELANEQVTTALPLIVRAALEEKDPQTRMNIAAAATWLGSPEGLDILKGMCADNRFSVWVRVNAARNAFDRGDHSCFAALAQMAQSGETDTRIYGLQAASQIASKTEQEGAAVSDLAARSLADPDIRMRLEACETLRRIDRADGIAPLRTAIQREREEIVRSQMEAALKYLLKQHPAS